MIIDGHRHIVNEYNSILKEMDNLGISKTVLTGIGVKNLNIITIHDSFIFRSHFLVKSLGMIKAKMILNSLKSSSILMESPSNDHVLRAIKERPDRFFGFVFINPELKDALDTIQHYIREGMVGIKMALFQYPTDLTGNKMKKICEIARLHNIPIFIH